METPLKKFLLTYPFLFGIAAVIIGLDQWTKHLVMTGLVFGKTWTPWPTVAPFVNIINWKNTGVAFGMFQDKNTLFAIVAAIVAVGIIYYFPRVEHKDWVIRLALAMMLGGAVGNLIDRVRIGYVIDFVSVGNFAVFNVADSSITVGVVVLMLGVWLQEKRQKQEVKGETTPETSSVEEGETH
jgi:signal peptidase II